MNPLKLENKRATIETALRQYLYIHGLMVHLKITAEFKEGILTYTIDTDPRAVKFIFPKIGRS